MNETLPANTQVMALGSGITLLGVIRILGEQGIPTLAQPDVDATTRRSRWYHPAPASMAGLTTARLAESLAALPEGTILVPCSDAWVMALSRLPDDIKRKYPCSVPPEAALEVMVDKSRFRAALERLQLPHPRTLTITSAADLDAVDLDTWQSPFLKPSDSQRFFARFGIKAFPTAGADETRKNLKACLDAGLPMMLQEYIPGPPTNHYFIDGFIDRTGVVRAVFARQRLRMHPLDFGNSSLMVSVPVSDVQSAVDSLTTLFTDQHYRGVFSAEVKRSTRDGAFNLIEVNARPWWFVEFAARCGVDVCRMSVLDALELPVPTVTHYALGKRCVFPSYDWSAMRDGGMSAGAAAIEGVRSWMGAYQPVFRWNDPRPALGNVFETIRRRFT